MRYGPCPACSGTGIVWIHPPEPGEPSDPGEYEYCSCADGEQRRRTDMRLVDRICNEIIDYDEILNADVRHVDVDCTRQDIDRRRTAKATLRSRVERRRAV